MTEKRFTYIKNSSITQYQSIPIQEIGKGKTFHCQGIVDKLNKLSDENEELLKENNKIKTIILQKLKELEYDYERSAKAGMPTGSIIGEIYTFEEICKEMDWLDD